MIWNIKLPFYKLFRRDAAVSCVCESVPGVNIHTEGSCRSGTPRVFVKLLFSIPCFTRGGPESLFLGNIKGIVQTHF